MEVEVKKYVDDVTLVEALSKEIPYTEDNTGNKIRHTVHPPSSQLALDTISTSAKKKKMH